MKIKDYKLFLESSQTEKSVKEICEEYRIKNWSINSEGLVDVDGGVYLSVKGLTKIPLKFGNVTGDFDCNDNLLTSLEGSPREVGGSFYCASNQLTSLEGAPENLSGNFYCCDNQLTTLEGSPKEVGGYFNCSSNKLTTLEGGPKEVGGYFNCSDNQLTSLEESPKSVGHDFICSYNKLASLKGGPEVVIGSYYAHNNQVTSFEGFPDDFDEDFSFYGNPVQDILNQFPPNLWVKAIHLINDYDAIWRGEVIPERLEMVREKLGITNENN